MDSEKVWAESYRDIVDGVAKEYDGARFRVAGELECYIPGDDQPNDAFWEGLGARCKDVEVSLESIGLENAKGQYEFRLRQTEPWQAACEVERLKALVGNVAQEAGFTVLFDPMIKVDEERTVFNGLHIHVHMITPDEQYLYIKKEDQMTRALRGSLGGLVATMNDMILCFAPHEDSYDRLHSGADHVPSVVSWGGNNRTVALRMPESVVPWRHIEHRVSGADANPYAAIWAVLVGIDYGLKHEPDPGEQMYGRASDKVYNLPVFPENIKEAEIAFSGSEIIANYCTESIRRALFTDA
ncbi:MAG: hypothetical protein MRY32_04005 [Rickettsiales bacterium]|nr:hypothetical protein [Rickettsiales bacterium]